MSAEQNNSLTRIGVFYDGNYFLKVSNYYNYYHERKRRISIEGLHDFVRKQVAKEEDVDYRRCHIVDAHYFRGRLSAREAKLSPNELLYNERAFEDILMGEGVITHYLPLKNSKNPNKTKEEKGIDVWLALEAYELAYYKRFNVLVLVACDGDYVPLVRKLNTLGTRVMLLSWDFKYLDQNNDEKVTRTSQDLLEEVTYPIAMHEIIENRVTKNEPTIENLFVNAERHVERETYNNQQEDFQESTIMHVKEGYGFIKYPPNNLFFHFSSLQNMDFNDLVGGEKVKFKIETKPDGQPVAVEVTVCKR